MISKAVHLSQNTVAKVIQRFMKYGSATISQRHPGHPRMLTPRQEHLLMRRVEENRYASSLQLAKEVESQTGLIVCDDTAEEWHAWVSSTKEACPKPQTQKNTPRICQSPC
ncbi:hypothetical protein GOODEAATRI_022682 [Goodea atripinnis]|uniref:Transposase n=1 Tax=Goodea atripinnis TaxID=208336 RepID=A0ABV0PG83_9TELE